MPDIGSAPSRHDALRQARRVTTLWIVLALVALVCLALTLPRGVIGTMSTGIDTSAALLVSGVLSLALLAYCAYRAVRSVGDQRSAQRALDIEIAEQIGMAEN